jgi:N-acetylmuramic acid 6-phosphate etherase
MRPDYGRLPTEAAHPQATDLELRPVEEIVQLLIAEEARAQRAAASCTREIARAAEIVVAALRSGGRLFYVGAGTSGRLGALDAAELPPTFGSQPSQVIALLAGGARAMLRSVEGAEDRAQTAATRLARHDLSAKDVVCAIAASGVTPFSRAALEYAKQKGAKTLFVTCVKTPQPLADVVMAAPVGPEVLAGSTRLKAGSATKMILNALSTATMVKLGKVYRGRMVDVVASNQKLRDRARRIVMELTGLHEKAAQSLLKQARFRPKIALVMHALDVNSSEAARLLDEAGGDLHRLLRPKSGRKRKTVRTPSRSAPSSARRDSRR